jgi:Flp pilus assembly protein TadG
MLRLERTIVPRCTGDRGTILVESALIFPIMVYLFFAILEYSLVFRSYLTLGNGLRAAGRTAAIAGDDADADWKILQATKNEMAAVQRSTVARVVIYDATPVSPSTTPVAVPAICKTGPRGGNTTAKCNVYVPTSDWATSALVTDYGCNLVLPNTDDLAAGFCPGPSGAWTGRNVKTSGPPSVVGIYIEIQHPFLTRIFGTTKTLSDTQFAAIEPRQS